MAALQATKKPPKEGFGQKVKNIVEAVGTIKGIYDTGRTIYILRHRRRLHTCQWLLGFYEIMCTKHI